MPFFVSIIWGVVVSVVVFTATPLLLLGELGGPNNWAVPILIATMITLAIAVFTSRPRSAVVGAGCGIAFSLPVVIVCHLLRRSDPTILREHGGQLSFAAFAAVVISVMMMAVFGESRKEGSRKYPGKPPANKNSG